MKLSSLASVKIARASAWVDGGGRNSGLFDTAIVEGAHGSVEGYGIASVALAV